MPASARSVPRAGQDESAEGVDATISTVDQGSSVTTAASGTSATTPTPGSGTTAATAGAVLLRIEAEVGMGGVEVLRR